MFGNLVRDASGRAQDVAHEVSDRAHEYADQARVYAGRAGQYAGRVGEQAGQYAGQARSYAGDYAHHLNESPLAHQAGKVPTDLFLIAAGGSIVGSLVLKLMGRHRDAEFVGHWAPTLLTLGLLSKLVSHDENHR